MKKIIQFNSALSSRPRQSLTYALVSYVLVFPAFRLLFRGRIVGKRNVPEDGGVVIVANHGSHLDPPLIGHALGRPIAFMAKAELFKIPFLSKVISACGAYPMRRGAGDREAIKLASDRLKKGWATGVFLDGTRQNDGRVNAPKAGAAFLAARTGCSLLPVAIVNSHRAFSKGSILPRLLPIHLRIGELIPPPITKKKGDIEATTNRLQLIINAMLDEGLIDK